MFCASFIPAITAAIATFCRHRSNFYRGGGQGGGSPGEQGAGGVWETGEERVGGGISTMAGSGRKIIIFIINN